MIPHHQSHYHSFRLGELGRVFLAHTLINFASGLVTVFVPIFFLKLGYSLTAVLVYLLWQGLLSLLLQIPAMYLLSRLGGNRTMALGMLFLVSYFALLISAPHWPHEAWLLVWPALAWSAYRICYFPAFHANFSKAKNHERSTKEIGAVQVMVTLVKSLGPAIGGVLATLFGINLIYGIALGLTAIAIVPLLTTPEVTRRRSPHLSVLNLRKLRRDLVAQMGNSITTVAEGMIWPIFVFYIVSTYAGVGLLSSVVALTAALVALYVSFRADRRGPRHYIREGVFLASVSDFFRLLAQNAGHVFGINFLGGVGNSLYYTPYFTRFYAHADEEPRVEYVTAMELAHETAWTILLTIMVVCSLFLKDTTVLLIGIALSIPGNFLIRAIR